MDNTKYYKKYLKYKNKYIKLKKNALKCGNNYNFGIWEELPNELYTIGDIHGDFFALKQSLELTNCVIFDKYDDKLIYDDKNKIFNLRDGCDYYEKDKVHWNSNKKNCFIVFSGDMIDRCRSVDNCRNVVADENCDLKIIKLLFDLDDKAQMYNSRVILILGNHEINNLNNDLRYVSHQGLTSNRVLELTNMLKNNINRIYSIVRIHNFVVLHGEIGRAHV